VAEDVTRAQVRAEHLVEVQADLQIPVEVIRTTASVGSMIFGSGTVSTAESPCPATSTPA